jgi:YihY family inner membrane protein
MGAAVGAASAVAARAFGRRGRETTEPPPDGSGATEPVDPATRAPMREAGPIKPQAKEDAAGKPRKPNKWLTKADAFQRQHGWAAFPFAVVKKFGDDQAGNLAALIAYYGFISLFPLLLALTTVLATVLAGDPELQRRILNSALAQFPVIGDQIRTNVHSLHGNAVALTVGIVGAVWGGMGVMKAAGNAMDEVWEVPKRERPKLLKAIARAAMLLAVLGSALIGTTILAGLGTSHGSLPLKLIGIIAAIVLNVGLFVLGFRVLTVRDVGWRDLVPGAVVAGVGWFVLQSVGGYYVTHQLKGASQTYGVFAIVIGLLSWLYLQAQLTLLASEINVVKASGLWPRSLAGDMTHSDKTAYAAYAEVEERRRDEDVDVGFEK